MTGNGNTVILSLESTCDSYVSVAILDQTIIANNDRAVIDVK